MTLLALACLVCAAVLLKFGTLEPCGILRAQLREEAARDRSLGAAFAAILPDAALDALIQATYGPLTRSRCLTLLLNHEQPKAPTVTQAPPPRAQPGAQGDRFIGASCYMGECGGQYIVATERDASGIVTIWLRVRQYKAEQPSVTLGQSTMAYHALCKMPGGYLENERGQRMPEPTVPNHANEPYHRVWIEVCSVQ